MALGSTQPLIGMSIKRPPTALLMKSGNVNFLEPSGPLQACNGTDLLFTTEDAVLHISASMLHCINL